MIWYCGACSRWLPGKHRVCPCCGRAAHGKRLCRRCKDSVPSDATFCPRCGGDDRLTPPAVRRRPLPVPARLGLVGLGGVAIWGLSLLLAPFAVAAWTQLSLLFWHLVFYLVLFWFFTGLLPAPWGKRVRAAVWWAVRFLARFVRNLFP